MESFAIFFVFFFYIWVRLALGHHKTPEMRDERLYKEGFALIFEKEYQKAKEYFVEKIQFNPKSSLAWLHKGKCNFLLGNYYQALADCQNAIKINHSLAEAYFWQARAFVEIQEYENALETFNKGIWHFREGNAEIFRHRGLLFLMLNETEKANEDFKQAVKLGDEDSVYLIQKLKKKN